MHTKVERNAASGRHHAHHLLSRSGPSSNIQIRCEQIDPVPRLPRKDYQPYFDHYGVRLDFDQLALLVGMIKTWCHKEQARPIYRDDTITIGSLRQFALVSATRAPCNTIRRRNLVELKLELKKFERKVLNSPRSAQI
jgi:hypothetical protein